MRNTSPFGFGLSLTLCVGLWSVDARADHTRETPITDDSAFTQKAGTFRLGIARQEYSIFDSITLGTYGALLVLGTPSLFAKWRVYSENDWSFALRVGGLWFDADNVLRSSGGKGRLTILPASFFVSHWINPTWTMTGGVTYTAIRVEGSFNEDQYEGAAASSNLQVHANIVWTLSRTLAINTQLRYLIFQHLTGIAKVHLAPDDFTRIDAEADASTGALDYPKAWSIVPSFVWSWKTFNLRAGLGYGNWSIPPVNVVLPNKTPIVDFGMYWIF